MVSFFLLTLPLFLMLVGQAAQMFNVARYAFTGPHDYFVWLGVFDQLRDPFVIECPGGRSLNRKL